MHKEQPPTLQLLLGFWRRQPYRYQMISKRTDTSRNINYCSKIYLLTDSLLRSYGDCPDRLWGDCSLIPVDKFLHWFQKESWKGILLGMITWLMVQLKLEKERRHWHPLTILFEEQRYCTIRNRTPNQGDWGGGKGGGGSYSSWKKRHSCRIPTWLKVLHLF